MFEMGGFAVVAGVPGTLFDSLAMQEETLHDDLLWVKVVSRTWKKIQNGR